MYNEFKNYTTFKITAKFPRGWRVEIGFKQLMGGMGFRGDNSLEIVLVNTLRPRQNGRYFPDIIFKCIFLNKNVRISIQISWKYVPESPINNVPALV